MKVEGKNQVIELLKGDAEVEKIMLINGTQDAILRKIQQTAHDKQIKVEFVQKNVLDKISETEHHQGVIAFATEYKYYDLSEIIKKSKNDENSLFIVLDEISDPHNLGAVARVAECAGATAVIIPNRRSATVNETVIRTSAGATSFVPIVKVTNLNSAIEELKNAGIWVYALDMDGESIYKTNLTGKTAIVVGSEGKGIRPLTKKLCDAVISIPMFGKINSLNASVSTGIAVYEYVRQNLKNLN